MPLAKNLSAYEDLRSHFDRALQSVNGIRITTPSHGAAVSMRARFYALRKLEREHSIEIYDPGDERRGRSPYENMSIEVEDNQILIKHVAPILIEDL